MDIDLRSENKNKDEDSVTGIYRRKEFASCCKEPVNFKYQDYFPPQEIFNNAIRTSDLWKMKMPEYTPLTKYMLISLMEIMKCHPTNEHVCLMWSKPESHHQFNAYSLQIVRPRDLNNSSHFTLSKLGFLFFNTNGFTEYIYMDEFERELNFFEQINEIKFFKQFRLWKMFIVWRSGLSSRSNQSPKSEFNPSASTVMMPMSQINLPDLNRSMKGLEDQIMSTKNSLNISLDICDLVQKYFRRDDPERKNVRPSLMLLPILSQLNRNNCLYTENQKKLLTELLNTLQ